MVFSGDALDLACLDLAEHLGQETSTWGNQAWQLGRPLDPVDAAWMRREAP